MTKRRRLLLDIQDVRKRVQGSELVWIALSDVIEENLGCIEVAHVVLARGDLGHDVRGVRKALPQLCIDACRLLVPLQLHQERGPEECGHPVVRQLQLSPDTGGVVEVGADGHDVQPRRPIPRAGVHRLHQHTPRLRLPPQTSEHDAVQIQQQAVLESTPLVEGGELLLDALELGVLHLALLHWLGDLGGLLITALLASEVERIQPDEQRSRVSV
mmetsp:Transcript_54288/g.156084  ORF Transcript_54288/g.156084 Transcript_54288/m.156084 type:complete len:215 (+) Transcript_54288:943-1587(+)